MNELQIPEATKDLSSVSTAELREQLHVAIGLTARAVAHVAAIWNELTRRGEDLSGVKFALRDYMSAVASGRLLPEAVALLAGRLRTLDAVAQLPVSDQRLLISGAEIDVVTPNGTVVTRTIDEMNWTEAARVLRDGTIRTPAEQRLALSRQEAAAKRRNRPRGRPPRLVVDAENNALRLGTMSVPLERVLSTLRAAGYHLAEPKT